MRAFVLGGGGNLGAMQVGALKALLEQGIRPDLIVGCSVGALNAAMLANDYSLATVDYLEQLWQNLNGNEIFPGSKMSYAWRFLTCQDGLCSNQGLYKFLIKNGITPQLSFDCIADIPLYVTATNLTTGRLDVFGHNANAYVLDALMATSAQPPLLPPWEIDGVQYVDGGTVTPLPLRSAIELGATEIYSLRVEHQAKQPHRNIPQPPVRGMAGVVRRSVSMMIQQQAEYDLFVAKNRSDVMLHELELACPITSRTDFSDSHILCQHGYEITHAHLERRTVRLPKQQFAPQRTPVPLAQSMRGDFSESLNIKLPMPAADLCSAAD